MQFRFHLSCSQPLAHSVWLSSCIPQVCIDEEGEHALLHDGSMNRTAFFYDLPKQLIAQYPADPRDSSSMLVATASQDLFRWDTHFYDFPHFLTPQDLLVVNNSKVSYRRILVQTRNKQKVSVTLCHTDPKENSACWRILAHPTQRLRMEKNVLLPDGQYATVTCKDSHFYLTLPNSLRGLSLENWLNQYGTLPLPPYIKRAPTPEDQWRYQTPYARYWGSVAAPTAGLHFSPRVLANLRHKEIAIAELTLHVGIGTFAPLRSPTLQEHVMHEEHVTVPLETLKALRDCRQRAGRIVAVGTTVVRALESLRLHDWESAQVDLSFATRLFIQPGFSFQLTDALLTNYHMPESTLLVLVAAFWGYENMMNLYQESLKRHRRFGSYGDCMFLSKECVPCAT